jgi:hypothetical protein
MTRARTASLPVVLGLAVLAAAGGLVGGFTLGRETAPTPSTRGVVTLAAEERADPVACRRLAGAAMTAALVRDGDLESLPRLPDRSLGIEACKGLSKAQLDEVAEQLKVDLAPVLLAASVASATAAP